MCSYTVKVEEWTVEAKRVSRGNGPVWVVAVYNPDGVETARVTGVGLRMMVNFHVPAAVVYAATNMKADLDRGFKPAGALLTVGPNGEA